MKTYHDPRIATRKPALGHLALLLSAAIAAVSCLASEATAGLPSDQYTQINLVSDLPDISQIQDTNLVNAWGISFGPNSPFWINDNGSGLATIYSVTNDSTGTPQVTRQGLVVNIPTVGFPIGGAPSGQVFNGSANWNTNLFLFVGEDGVISGWRPALGNNAEVLTNRTTAVYKGVTIFSNSMGELLLVANFREATVDVYDGNTQLIGQFKDHNAPVGFAPFNIANLGGYIFVTYAKQDGAKHDDVPGKGNGLVDIFNPLTGKFRRFATGSAAGGNLSAFNSPWGLAISPSSFGVHANQLLVGNFASGTIMSFDTYGGFQGFLEGENDERIVIDGLWALIFGGGNGKTGSPDTLFFTAGPYHESHGLFGALQPSSNTDPDENKHHHHHGHDRD